MNNNGNIGTGNYGYHNYGDFNHGNWNYGESNCGDRNIGNRNIGNGNIGNWNCTDNAYGHFNTKPSTEFCVFNKPYNQELWDTYRLLPQWLYYYIGNEKAYLIPMETSWNNATHEDKMRTYGIPNFDADIAQQIFSIYFKRYLITNTINKG